MGSKFVQKSARFFRNKKLWQWRCWVYKHLDVRRICIS